MGLLLALITAVSFAISNVFARRGLAEADIDRFLGLFITMIINNIINIPFILLYLLSQDLDKFNWWGIFFFALAGFLNTFAGRGLLFSSIEHIGPSRAGTLKITAPVFAIIMGVLILGEKIRLQTWIGILIVLVGVVMITQETKGKGELLAVTNSNRKKPAKKFFNKGISLGLMAGMIIGIGNIFRKIGVSLFPGFIVGVFIGSLVAVISCGVFLLMRYKKEEIIALVSTNWRGPYLKTGIATSIALYSLFFALKLTPVSIVSSINATEPLFTMLASYMLLGNKERLRVGTIFRIIVIITGLTVIFIFR